MRFNMAVAWLAVFGTLEREQARKAEREQTGEDKVITEKRYQSKLWRNANVSDVADSANSISLNDSSLEAP